MPLIVKICGLSAAEHVAAALSAGADMIGFVFVPKSPRNVTLHAARALAAPVAPPVRKVALVVDPDDALIRAIVAALAPDLFQLHGREAPQRAAEIRRIAATPVMKAVGVAEPADLAGVAIYASCVDHILIDAKPPRDAAYPGGHGRTFDWAILEAGLPALDPGAPFMLSGGLHAGNIGEAVRRTRPWGIDVSSGVECAPGVKDVVKIAAFVAAARAAERLSH